jgi:hypothetical protein
MEMMQYITLTQATKLCPTRPHTATIWRWCRKGVKTRSGERIRLEHVRMGGRVLTTEENMLRFFKEVADSDTRYFESFDKPIIPTVRPRRCSAARRQKEIAAAERRLEEAFAPKRKMNR